MRISESQVFQLVNSEPPQLVFLDESTGAEVTRPATLETVLHLIDDITTARIENRPLEVDDIRVPVESFDKLLTAIGYFTARVIA